MSRSLYFGYLLLVAVAAASSELQSLLEFKKGIHGDPNRNVLPKWEASTLPDLASCPGTWPGVTCDPATGSVVSIALDRLGLSGDLKFSTLLGLKSLQNLTLSGNSFTGRLVPAIGSMSSLRHLDLSDNLFSGPIPGRISALWNLRHFNLSMNRFSGWFPVGLPVSFRNLKQLQVLDLRGNSFSGDVGLILHELVNVEYLDLSENMFGGGFDGLGPENISGLANTARYLNFRGNLINGRFWKQEALELFRNLEVLDMGSCGVNGELPSFDSLSKLVILRLGKNNLFGHVPEELINGSLPLLELDLGYNGFTGSIPGISSSTLYTLNLSSNGLSGLLPTVNGSCAILDFSRNSLSGDISVIMHWDASPEVLDLSCNQLSGSLPNLDSQFSKLTKLNLRNNSIGGILRPDFLAFSMLSDIDFSLNLFTGQVLSGFFTSLTLTSLNLSRNQFEGPIPLQGSQASELLSLPSGSRMQLLDLSHNHLSGIIPSDIRKLGLLTEINFSNNSLSGRLPLELSTLSFMQHLDLSYNGLEGSIPGSLPESLTMLNLSHNHFSGEIPDHIWSKFGISSFFPGNPLLASPNSHSSPKSVPDRIPANSYPHKAKRNMRTLILVVGSIIVCLSVVSLLFVVLLIQRKRYCCSGEVKESVARGAQIRKASLPSFFKFYSDVHRTTTSLSFSSEHFIDSNPRTSSAKAELPAEHVEQDAASGLTAASPDINEIHPMTSGRKSSPGSPLPSSPRFFQGHERSVMLDVYSPDRLAGQLSFLDTSLAFTPEELSRAPAEVLGRSSHGTLYKATLDGGHMLTVKWLRVGFVKHKKEFSKEVKKMGSIRHPNVVPLRAYYWGPREQERLLLADYVEGDSLALHLYETTPRRYPLMSLSQRFKVAVDVARCLLYLHDRGWLHGNLKPTNILLEGAEYTVRLSDYGMHRLMTPVGVAEQILNLGALGYRAPELVDVSKPCPSLKADVYAFGVILMELLTRRSAGDIMSGQSGAVDLPDWVRLCDQEGRRIDCLDRDIAGLETPPKAMDDLLAISLKCILPVNERPNIRQVLQDLSSVSV